jgi:hypothetical protein
MRFLSRNWTSKVSTARCIKDRPDAWICNFPILILVGHWYTNSVEMKLAVEYKLVKRSLTFEEFADTSFTGSCP